MFYLMGTEETNVPRHPNFRFFDTSKGTEVSISYNTLKKHLKDDRTDVSDYVGIRLSPNLGRTGYTITIKPDGIVSKEFIENLGTIVIDSYIPIKDKYSCCYSKYGDTHGFEKLLTKDELLTLKNVRIIKPCIANTTIITSMSDVIAEKNIFMEKLGLPKIVSFFTSCLSLEVELSTGKIMSLYKLNKLIDNRIKYLNIVPNCYNKYTGNNRDIYDLLEENFSGLKIRKVFERATDMVYLGEDIFITNEGIDSSYVRSESEYVSMYLVDARKDTCTLIYKRDSSVLNPAKACHTQNEQHIQYGFEYLEGKNFILRLVCHERAYCNRFSKLRCNKDILFTITPNRECKKLK